MYYRVAEEPDLESPALAAWKLPVIVAAIATSIVGGFYIGGPSLGMAVGALAAGVIIVMAVRKPPLRAIIPPTAADPRRHILVVLSAPLEEAEAIEAAIAVLRPGAADLFEPEVRLLAPSPSRFLDRWACDLGPARERAQRSLVLSAAALAGAGISASARLGDEEVVQTIEDELRTFPANEVLLVGAAGKSKRPAGPQIADLRSRLSVPLRLLTPTAPLKPAMAASARADRRGTPEPAGTPRVR
ncbi:MAG: hypothetical protein U0R26_09940 [Solirubrobacterales bacterium]